MDSKKLQWLNSLTTKEAEDCFFKCCGSKMFAEKVVAARPFTSSEHLIQVIDRVWNKEVDVHGVLESFLSHPRIGDKPPAGLASAKWSEGEQAAAQNSANTQLTQELADWNKKYEAKFGHVFLICAAGRRSEEILAELKRRYDNAPLVELQVAAAEQHKITKLRLDKLEPPPGAKTPTASSGPSSRLALIASHLTPLPLSSPGSPASPHHFSPAPVPSAPAGAQPISALSPSPASSPATNLRPPITTHVLDVTLGRPAADLPVSLEALEPGSDLTSSSTISAAKWRTIGVSKTDGDGRSGPLMEKSDFIAAGVYRLTFATSAYYGSSSAGTFYPFVSVTFEIQPEQTGQHFHVPVLLSPFAYSTYRGS